MGSDSITTSISKMNKSFKFTILFLFFFSSAYSQSERVELKNSVYDYLQRLHTKGIIERYSNASLPLTRAKITEYIKYLCANTDKLSETELRTLNDLESEFHFDIFKNDSCEIELFQNGNFFSNFSRLCSDKERYIYSYKDSSSTFYLNALFETKSIFSTGDIYSGKNAHLLQWGGSMRGAINKSIGYYLLVTNGQFLGSRDLIINDLALKNNYKIQQPTEKNFDFTEGYVTYTTNNFVFQAGREKITIGNGYNEKMLISSVNAMDFIKMDFELGVVSYTFIHNWILPKPDGYVYNQFKISDRIVDSKYLAIHRLGLSLFRNNLEVGFSEMIVYSNRPPEIAYMTPLIFYKSVEHSLQDRDNAILSSDISLRVVPGIKLYGTLIVDELDFSKIGTNWWGNLFSYQVGGIVSEPFQFTDFDLNFEYIKILPFTYSHKFIENNYTNFNSFIGPNMHPNSDKLWINGIYYYNNRLDFNLGVGFGRHGRNIYDEDGNVIKNVGGDINLGHRYEDSETSKFLDGKLEKMFEVKFGLNYEIYNNLYFQFNYSHSSIKDATEAKQNTVNFIISINY